jgi:hypothetical protein
MKIGLGIAWILSLGCALIFYFVDDFSEYSNYAGPLLRLGLILLIYWLFRSEDTVAFLDEQSGNIYYVIEGNSPQLDESSLVVHAPSVRCARLKHTEKELTEEQLKKRHGIPLYGYQLEVIYREKPSDWVQVVDFTTDKSLMKQILTLISSIGTAIVMDLTDLNAKVQQSWRMPLKKIYTKALQRYEKRQSHRALKKARRHHKLNMTPTNNSHEVDIKNLEKHELWRHLIYKDILRDFVRHHHFKLLPNAVDLLQSHNKIAAAVSQDDLEDLLPMYSARQAQLYQLQSKRARYQISSEEFKEISKEIHRVEERLDVFIDRKVGHHLVGHQSRVSSLSHAAHIQQKNIWVELILGGAFDRFSDIYHGVLPDRADELFMAQEPLAKDLPGDRIKAVLSQYFRFYIKQNELEEKLIQYAEASVDQTEQQRQQNAEYQNKITQLSDALLKLEDEMFFMFDEQIGEVLSVSDLDGGARDDQLLIEKVLRRERRISKVPMYLMQGILFLELVLFIITGKFAGHR